MAATALSGIAGPGPIIPTFPPPPPVSSSSTPAGTPSSRSALPGSILSISHSTSGETSAASTDPQSSPTSTPTTSASTPTDSQPPSSGTPPADTSANPSATPTPSTSSGAATMTSQQSSAVSLPSSSSSPTVITAASHHTNAGAIAGGVIGGLAFAILAVGALLLLLRRRNKQKSQNEVLPWSSGGLGRRRGEVRISSSSGLAGVGDISSGDGFTKRMSGAGYGVGVAGSDLPARHPTASNAAVLGRHATAPSASSHTHGYSQSNDEFGGAYSDDEEKNSTLQNHDSYSQHNKSFDLADTGIPQLPIEPPSAYPSAAQRSRSVGAQDYTLAQLVGSPVSRSPSGSSVLRDPFASPHDPKRASGGAHRRPTQRKAVPKYDEGEFSMAPLSAPTSPTSPVSPLPRPAAPPRVPSAERLEAVRPASGALLGTPLPALNPKSSFGDMRPVHYLIPDLPPPQKE